MVNEAHKERYERHKQAEGERWVLQKTLAQMRASAPPRGDVKGINHQTSEAMQFREKAKKEEKWFQASLGGMPTRNKGGGGL